MKGYQKRAEEILKVAGITVNGSAPYDMQVHDERVYRRVFADGTLGLGESYMDGWWDAEDLPELFLRVMRADLYKEIANFGTIMLALRAKLTNMQSGRRAFEVGEKHYDIGNDLYGAMLDSRMIYSCGYWKDAQNLNEAQEAKLDLICRKIGLKQDDTVLDIGCGWGGFLKFAAEKYGAKGVGITVSKEQAALARKNCEGLPVEIRVEDYHDTQGQFDHIISIGMFEHVGPKNYRSYMQKVHSLLKEDGLFLLHTIGAADIQIRQPDPWFHKYIFPNGVSPSGKNIMASIERLFIMEDWHNFGADYDRTLMQWWYNFDRTWPTLKDKYGERFYRMWKYYLLSVAGAFRGRQMELWQVVLTKKGIVGGYKSVR
ncbi:MAG: cyclopropane fatty acyl phospholipid synthase [Patescibacteria group bacterium]